MINKDFFKQLEEISKEKGIPIDQVSESMMKALANTYKKTHNVLSVRYSINKEKCEILMYTQQYVVENLEDEIEVEMDKIVLSDAKMIKGSYKVGDIVEMPINLKDFGRSRITAVKNVFNQDIKNIEREIAYKYFKDLENEMISGTVIEINNGNATQKGYITLNIGHNITTLLPKTELLPNDRFQLGDSLRVYVKKVEETTKDPKVFVSRSERNLVTRLLESVIPEIKDGIIQIKGIARDPGDRSKIAIYSTDPKVDPIGSCVGEGGNRIKEVVSALNGEKIDLYRWSENVEEMIANSLQPAAVTKVLNVDHKDKTSLVIVPDNQLSLAIGKQGQNVRLAVLSCGWKIDIKPTSEAYKEDLLF